MPGRPQSSNVTILGRVSLRSVMHLLLLMTFVTTLIASSSCAKHKCPTIPSKPPIVVKVPVYCWESPGKALLQIAETFRWPEPDKDGITRLTIEEATAFDALIGSLVDYIDVQLKRCYVDEKKTSP